jgi:glycosyltransferase involved in cell wall biosynthesis
MPRNDVAVYSPGAAVLYERRPLATGGAERQATLLATGLAQGGLRVAHIVLPVEERKPDLGPNLTLVERPLVTTKRGPQVRLRQVARIWSALAKADADVYVFRHGLPAVGIAALFCRLRRRKLIFAASSDLDFTFGFFVGRRPELRLYKFGIKSADAVVIQTRQQEGLARESFPGLRIVREIPSFAEPAAPSNATPEAFLWVGRLDRSKRPLLFVELAEAVPEARFWMIARPLDPERAGGSPDGTGPDLELEREVGERAARLSNLELLPLRPHREAMELVERSVAVVNTGPVEGMPNVFLEGWARGVPALTYEFDPDGRIERDGLGVAAAGSQERFAAGARKLWHERDSRGQVSERVRAYIEATHGLDAVTARWIALIDEVRVARR